MPVQKEEQIQVENTTTVATKTEDATEVHTPTTVNQKDKKFGSSGPPAIPPSPGVLSTLSVMGSMRSDDSVQANKSNSQLAISPMKTPELTPSTPTVVEKPPEEEKKAVAPPPKPAAKPAPAPSGRRRRVIKKPEEKKKEQKVIECIAELDGEIMAGKSIYIPEVDLKEALDLPVVDQ